MNLNVDLLRSLGGKVNICFDAERRSREERVSLYCGESWLPADQPLAALLSLRTIPGEICQH